MADTISDAIKKIRVSKRKLEAELRLLEKAEAALKRIVKNVTDSDQRRKEPEVAVSHGPPIIGGVSGAVVSALRDLGEAESGQVVAQVRKKYLPDANENSIRSLLSVWAVKGRVIRQEKKYSLPKETQDEGPHT